MPNLMTASPAPLTLPVAALARIGKGQPAWLRDCVASVQSKFVGVAFAAAHAPADRREVYAHEADALREMLIDAWMDAICPLPAFGSSFVFGNSPVALPNRRVCLGQNLDGGQIDS